MSRGKAVLFAALAAPLLLAACGDPAAPSAQPTKSLDAQRVVGLDLPPDNGSALTCPDTDKGVSPYSTVDASIGEGTFAATPKEAIQRYMQLGYDAKTNPLPLDQFRLAETFDNAGQRWVVLSGEDVVAAAYVAPIGTDHTWIVTGSAACTIQPTLGQK